VDFALQSVPNQQAAIGTSEGIPLRSSRPAEAALEHVFAGTSGWAYPSWKPDFYPAGLAAKRFLPFYSSQLNSVEVNYTFRQLPSASTLENWLASVPSGFRFSFKAPQRITHIKRLRDSHSLVAQFVHTLEPVRQAGKLGLLLLQLPPNLKLDLALLSDFLSSPVLHEPGAVPIAFEFRHPSWFADPVYTLLGEHNAALCIAETEDLQTPEVHPASTHTSFRMRRSGGYASAELDHLAARCLALAQHRDVYVYFKHEEDPSGALDSAAFLKQAVRLSSGQGTNADA
jgi:uncharacterized protein YecE (DUF72 family)